MTDSKNPKLHDDFDSFNIDDNENRASKKESDEFDTFNIEDDSDSGSHISILGNNSAADSNITSDNGNKSPGIIIREARTQQHMSVLQVSENLNLDVNVIEWIEADDYAKLPPPLFIRGYLRSLAKLLTLDEKSLLAAFANIDRNEAEHSTSNLLS